MLNEIAAGEKGIYQLISTFVEGWNLHDAKLFSSAFANDADFTNVFGKKAHGRNQIEEFHASNFSTIFKNSVLKQNEVSIRFLHSDLAAVDFEWEMSGATDPDGNPWSDRKGLINLIVKNEDDAWLILIMHNMDLPTPPSQKN